jgi:hypothetical protein
MKAKSQFQLPALDGAGLFVADAAVVGAAPEGWRLSWQQIRFNIAVKTYDSGLIFITSIKASNDAWSSACVSEGAAAAAAAAGGSASPFILILIFLTNSSSLSLFGSCPIANYNETKSQNHNRAYLHPEEVHLLGRSELESKDSAIPASGSHAQLNVNRQ